MRKKTAANHHLSSASVPEDVPAGFPADELPRLYNRIKMQLNRIECAANAADTGLWSLDLDTHVFWSNSKTKEIFNFPPDREITFDHFTNMVHPHDLFIIREAMQRAMQGERNISIEYRIVLPDGSTRWILSRGALCNCAENNASCLMGTSADITERKLKEEALARQVQFEALLAEISATFARFIMPADVDSLIERSLGRLLDYFGGDRCGLIKVDVKSRTSRITHAFYREGLERVPPDVDLPAMFPWAFDKSARGEWISFTGLDELPPEAKVDRRFWISFGVVSCLQVPIPVTDDVPYLILLQSVTSAISWPEEYVPRLQLMGEVFASAIFKKMAEEDLRNSYQEIARLKEKLEIEADYLRAEVRATLPHEEIIGQSEPIKKVLAMVEQVAPTASTVLVCGETGTGKELLPWPSTTTAPAGTN